MKSGSSLTWARHYILLGFPSRINRGLSGIQHHIAHSYLSREKRVRVESRARKDALSSNGNESRGSFTKGAGFGGNPGLLGHALSSVGLMDRSNYDNHGGFWLTHQTSHSFHQGILPNQSSQGSLCGGGERLGEGRLQVP